LSQIIKISVAAILIALANLPNAASSRERLYPLTQCGPDLAYLCRLHGSFASEPFHYNTAIYPGCIKTVAVETPSGVERRRVIVCGAPQRSIAWWW
jgi:hypothetical protein